MIDLNNPMNIRISDVPWHNKDVPSRNDQFETFPTAKDGLHAGILNIYNTQKLHGCTTISQIINRLSPPTENDTDAYIAAVCNICGVDKDENYDLTNPTSLLLLSEGIIKQENGVMPYSQDLMNEVINGILS